MERSLRRLFYLLNSTAVVLSLFALVNTFARTKEIIENHGNPLTRTAVEHLGDYNLLSHSPPRTSYKAFLNRTETFNRPRVISPVTLTLYELLGSPIYCENCTTSDICTKQPPEKFLRKQFWFEQPQYYHYNDGYPFIVHPLIPRIIHQSWFQEINAKDFPNLSRLQNSWKGMGWEYRFYSDEDAAKYISDHFPREIFEAYDALIPGAFKADFFRYCALFREGGIWADIDMQVQVNLNVFVETNKGFIVPRDIHGHGLHNALIMSAPGHPILAKAIEEATNMIRNRYTIIDIIGRYCPDDVNHDVLKDHMALFLTGPGLLAYAMHVALNRPLSAPFKAGLIERDNLLLIRNSATYSLNLMKHTGPGLIPGKTLILEREVLDMGETRYTDVDKNWIIAGTDIPRGYDTRKEEREHYSLTIATQKEKLEEEEKLVERLKLWGLDKVYKDNISADEQIKIQLLSRK